MTEFREQAVTDHRVMIDGPSVQRIAVLRALFLGDLICTTPAFRALHRRFPEAEITLIGLPWAAELVARVPYLHRLDHFPGYPSIIEVPYDAARTSSWLAVARAKPFDLAVQMHGSGRVTNGFIAALGARTTIGYHPERDNRLTGTLSWMEGEHEVLRWLRLVEMVGATGESTRVDWPVSEGDRTRAAALLAETTGGPLIGLHAGAKDAARRWPPERFAALGNTLANAFGARIVLTGAESERAISRAIQQEMRTPVLNLAGETDIGTFAAIIAQLDLLVTNDTGASHLAAASGTRSVVLFGPSNPRQWAPLDRERHDVLEAPVITGIANPAQALAALPVSTVFDSCATALTHLFSSIEHFGRSGIEDHREDVCAG